jgi:hypothetical protein
MDSTFHSDTLDTPSVPAVGEDPRCVASTHAPEREAVPPAPAIAPLASQEVVPESPRIREGTPLAESVGLAAFDGFRTQPNSPFTPSHGWQSGRKRPRTLVPGLAQLTIDEEPREDEVARLRAQVARLQDELYLLRLRLRHAKPVSRGPRPGATTLTASKAVQTSSDPSRPPRAAAEFTFTPRPDRSRAKPRPSKTATSAPADESVLPTPTVAGVPAAAETAQSGDTSDSAGGWETVPVRRRQAATSRSYAAVASSSGAAPLARPAAATGAPSPDALALAASLRSRVPRQAAGVRHAISRLYVPLKKDTYGNLRASLRKLGIDSARIPEIRFVGQSLTELWIHDEARVAITDRLRACGLAPISFNPRSPNSFRERGGSTSQDVAAARVRADRLFAGRLGSIIASCADADVREAARRLFEALPPDVRPDAGSRRDRSTGSRPSNAPRSAKSGPSRPGAPGPPRPAASRSSRPVEQDSNAQHLAPRLPSSVAVSAMEC